MIKKFLAVLICMTAVLGGAVLTSATTGADAVDYVDMREKRGFVADEYGDYIAIDYTEVVFELKNECGADMEFAPFVAFYSGTQFVDAVRAEAQEIATGYTAEFSVTSEVAFAENADSCKIFVLDDNIVPYADVTIGKLIAYDDNDIASDNYAYFIRAAEGRLGGTDIIRVQLLDKSGEARTTYLADTIDIANANTEVQAAASMSEADATVDLDDIDKEAFAQLLANQLVTYAANRVGEINAITFAKEGNDENTLSLHAAGNATFDEEDREATINGKKVTVTDDTIVFFIKGSNAISGIGDTENIANVAYSDVTTGVAVNNINGYAAAYDVDDDVAKVLVILNATSE